MGLKEENKEAAFLSCSIQSVEDLMFQATMKGASLDWKQILASQRIAPAICLLRTQGEDTTLALMP